VAFAAIVKQRRLSGNAIAALNIGQFSIGKRKCCGGCDFFGDFGKRGYLCGGI